MSGVDVLAVMDRLRQEWRDESVIVGRLDSADAIDSVFTAVAELIEAVDEYRSHIASFKASASPFALAQYRLDCALSRVRGAK